VLGLALVSGVEADAVIFHGHYVLGTGPSKCDFNPPGTGMLHDVVEGFLGNPEQCDFPFVGGAI
jgi:hypothetical protein